MKKTCLECQHACPWVLMGSYFVCNRDTHPSLSTISISYRKMPILKRVIGHASHMDRYYKTCPFCTRIQFSRYITNAICKSIEIRIPMVISNEKSWPPAAPSSSFLPPSTNKVSLLKSLTERTSCS